MKHTPGLWTIKKGIETKKWERRFYVLSENSCEHCNIPDNHHICVTLESAVGLEQAEANAKLIATAPELLEHAEYILKILKILGCTEEDTPRGYTFREVIVVPNETPISPKNE